MASVDSETLNNHTNLLSAHLPLHASRTNPMPSSTLSRFTAGPGRPSDDTGLPADALNSARRLPGYTSHSREDDSDEEQRSSKRLRQSSESTEQNSASATPDASRSPHIGARNAIDVSYLSTQRWQSHKVCNNWLPGISGCSGGA